MTTSTRLLLLRHGQQQQDRSKEDGALTPLGERQVLAVARAVGPVDNVLSSPLRRATATAALLGRNFAVLQGLAEFDFGPGLPKVGELVDERYDLTLWRASHGFPGGETLGDFQCRVAEVLEQLAAANVGGTVLLVTHSGFIDAALRWAYGLPADADWLAEAELPNASITEVEHWPHGRRDDGAPVFSLIRRIGDVRHLPPGLVTEI